ncbi:precorrin-4 C(11)-methyltransferase [Brevibacillus ginsengisoli]|uniref:precorrin-4 C(11)-methyltransferase n=1 Tax=Brevibacillus ginsengisoli TaxID=363854 RepID=UPI003CF9FEB6
MKLVIIGAGPGDPELITVKGLRYLKDADVVFYADSLVSESMVDQAKPGAEIVKTAALDLNVMVDMMEARLQEGKKVVRVHTGDPAIYGAIMEQIALLRERDIEVEVIPGVSSVFASAAAVCAELTIPDLTQTVILTRVEGRTPVPETEKLRELAKHHCTVALFLSSALTKKVVAEFQSAGWREDTPVAVVYRATWPDQRIIRTTLSKLDEDMRSMGISNQAMILAGWALDERIFEKDFRSKLYDREFTHGFRQGVIG